MFEHLIAPPATLPVVACYTVRKSMPWLQTFGHCGLVDIHRVPTLDEARDLLAQHLELARSLDTLVIGSGNFYACFPAGDDQDDVYYLFIHTHEFGFSLN